MSTPGPLRRALLAGLIATLLGPPAEAVVTRVSLTSRGEPLPGATLSIVDPDGEVVAEERTDERGAVVIDLPEGEGYRLRAPSGEWVGAPFAAGATLRIAAPPHLVWETEESPSEASGHADREAPAREGPQAPAPGGEESPARDDEALAQGEPAGPPLAEVPEETRKGDMVLGEAAAWPHVAPVLGAPIRVDRCDPRLEAQPLLIGTREGFTAAGLLKGLGSGALSTGLSLLSGGMVSVGGRSGRHKPKLQRDIVKRRAKSKIPHPDGHTKMRIGAKVEEDAITLSAYLDKAKGKGTIHAIYMETEDCRRFWPESYLAYGLWGQWNLSVSWTKTSETYRDGQLIDRSSSSGGWSTGWQRFPGTERGVEGITDPEALAALSEYQVAVLEEMGAPAWRRTGFSAPMSGPRSVGAVFRPEPELLAALEAGRLRTVVHVTREVDDVFETVAFPLQTRPGKRGLEFALAEGAF